MAMGERKDLVALVADKNMQFALRGILDTHKRLGIRPIDFVTYPHPKKDPGVFATCHDFLRPLQSMASFALVMFDCHGCGSASPREHLETEIGRRLAQNGWNDRSAVIAIEPELENWLWSDSPQVAKALGWPDNKLRTWLVQKGYRATGDVKPRKPKEAVEAVLRITRTPRSSAIYFDIATHVSFELCKDPAFIKLRQVLSGWFPATDQGAASRNR